MTHKLKILPKYCDELMTGGKNFELRKDDRGFRVCDDLEMWEFDPTVERPYTGRLIIAKIAYILRDCPQYGLQDGYAILALERIRAEWWAPICSS